MKGKGFYGKSQEHSLCARGVMFKNDINKKQINKYGQISVVLRPSEEAKEFIIKASRDFKYTEFELLTSSNKIFQNAYSSKYQKHFNDPVELINLALIDPNCILRFSLIGNNKRWYSTGRANSIKIRIHTEEYK